MISIGDKLVSEDLVRVHFVCDLNACKGACCVEGDSGAPVEADEQAILERIYPEVAPYLPERGRKAIEEQGVFVTDNDGDLGTPLVNGKECAYTVFEGETAFCGIELAWKAGKIDFQKPISCHLYPVRMNVLKHVEVEALNYDTWSICSPACSLGKSLKVPLYKFLKAPLSRKYGEAWYAELSEVLAALEKMYSND